MFAGTPTSIVVPLTGNLFYLVENHFSSIFEDPNDLLYQIVQHEIWYGVIDGNHFHAALMKLRIIVPQKWEFTPWKVIIVKSGYDLDEYRKLAVIQNEKNKQLYHYEATLFDMLISLRDISDNLMNKRRKNSRTGPNGVSVHHRDGPHTYDGGITNATRLCAKQFQWLLG